MKYEPYRRSREAGVLVALLLVGLPLHADDVDPWVYANAALDHFYNLEYEEAKADLKKALARDPDNIFFLSFLTNAYLFQELLRTGQLEGNLYSASNEFRKAKKPEPDPEVMALVRDHIDRMKKICEERLEANRYDTDALYILGIAHGIEANYKFTLEKKFLDALRAGSKANELHEQVLKLDPEYHDAKMIPGLYQYAVGSIPRSVKWLVYLLGHSGDKYRGIQLLQEAMSKGRLVTSDSAVLLAIIYGREDKHQYARKLLGKLTEFFPRNWLYALEIGRSYAREGNRKAALQVYAQVAERMEDGAPGYAKVPREKLYYQIGSMHQEMGEFDPALEAYAKVTEQEEGDGLLKAYSALRRAEIFSARNQPQRARQEYQRVTSMPYDEPRQLAQKRLRALKP